MSKVTNFEKLHRSIIFDGIAPSQNTKVYPSDIDGMIELKNSLLILMEFKEEGLSIPLGQRLALTRIADAWSMSGENKYGVVVKVEHSPEAVDVILAHETMAVSIYHKGEWKDLKTPKPLNETLERIVSRWEKLQK